MSRVHALPIAAVSLAVSLSTVVAPASADASAGGSAGAAVRPTCNGKAGTIIGTAGDDRIRGTGRADVIVGLGGNDEIRGFAGNDTICGNQGADDLFGGAGNDTLLGGLDQTATDPELDEYWADVLEGGAGNDLLDPGPLDPGHNADVLSFNKSRRGVHVSIPRHKATGEGVDRIRRRRGSLAILGSRHDDRLNGGPRSDTLMGSRGDDRIFGGGGGDSLYEGAYWMWENGYNWVPKDDKSDVDLLAGGARGDSLRADQHDTVIGAGGPDWLWGGGTVQRGGSGNDHLAGRFEGKIQVIDGGPGRDELEMGSKRSDGPLDTNLQTGRSTFPDRGLTFRFAGVEEIRLAGVPAWTVHGTAKPERFDSNGQMTVRAGGGNDLIDAWSTDDHIDGGPGRDEAWPGGGQDTCVSVEKIRYDPCPAPE